MNAGLVHSEILKGLDHGLVWIRKSSVISFVFMAHSLEFLY